jgi:hypothetical protein
MAGWLVVGAALVLAAAGPGEDARALVAGLSAPRRVERERAAARLEALGEAARPALVEAVESTDLELRARAAAVLDAIEGRALGRATPVTLDFRDVSLTEVLDAVSERTGLGLALQPWPDPRWGERKVTVVAPEPVPFWEAVARIGEAGDVRPDLIGSNRGMPMLGGFGGRPRARPLTGTEVMLTPDSSGPPLPSAQSGRFLVVLMALNHRRDRTLPGPHGRPAGSVADRFDARLQVLAEPDLTIGRVGEVEGLEAEDDRGLSLVPAGPVPEPPADGFRPANIVYNTRTASASIALRHPDRAGARLRRLRGVLPVTVVGSRSDPVAASLDPEAWGKPAHQGDVSLTVHEVRPVPEAANVRIIELSLVRPEAQAQPAGFVGPNRMVLAPPAATQGWFEFVDGAGKVVARIAAQPIFGDDSQRRPLRVVEPQGRAVSVRYIAPAWGTLNVPFEFRDLPMP